MNQDDVDEALARANQHTSRPETWARGSLTWMIDVLAAEVLRLRMITHGQGDFRRVLLARICALDFIDDEWNDDDPTQIVDICASEIERRIFQWS